MLFLPIPERLFTNPYLKLRSVKECYMKFVKKLKCQGNLHCQKTVPDQPPKVYVSVIQLPCLEIFSLYSTSLILV